MTSAGSSTALPLQPIQTQRCSLSNARNATSNPPGCTALPVLGTETRLERMQKRGIKPSRNEWLGAAKVPRKQALSQQRTMTKNRQTLARGLYGSHLHPFQS